MKQTHARRLKEFELKGDTVNFKKLTEENYHFYAMKHYDNPQCKGVEEFYEDLNIQKYVKRLFRRYMQNGELKERLILNHLIVFFNVFGPAATRMLLFKQDEDTYPILKSFLKYMGRIAGTETIDGVRFGRITADKHVTEVLGKI